MMIGSARVELLIYDVQSLKEKRSIIKSILTKLKQRYNLSVAETGYLEQWQRSEISLVTVANEQIVCERELQKGLKFIDGYHEVERTITQFEWL